MKEIKNESTSRQTVTKTCPVFQERIKTNLEPERQNNQKKKSVAFITPLSAYNHVSIFMLREQHKHRLSPSILVWKRGFSRYVWWWEPQRYVSTPPTRAPRWTLRDGAAPLPFSPLEPWTPEQTDGMWRYAQPMYVVCRRANSELRFMHVRIRALSYGYKRRYSGISISIRFFAPLAHCFLSGFLLLALFA